MNSQRTEGFINKDKQVNGNKMKISNQANVLKFKKEEER